MTSTEQQATTLRKARSKGPTPHLYLEGGGMVTRCDDPEIARPLMVDAWIEVYGLIELDSEEDAAELFPIDRASVQRGRVVPCDCGDCSWTWHPVREGATGRGITTAVVWLETR